MSTTYPKQIFQQTDKSTLFTLIEQYPLATVLLPTSGESLSYKSFPHISHLPFYVDKEKNQLIGHVSNHHPLAQILNSIAEEENSTSTHEKTAMIKLIFNGDNHYISPYCASNHVVPTWNYSAVHLQGKAKVITLENEKTSTMAKITEHFEQKQNSPWQLSNLNTMQIKNMLKAIRVFTLDIEQMVGTFKLSQHKYNDLKTESKGT